MIDVDRLAELDDPSIRLVLRLVDSTVIFLLLAAAPPAVLERLQQAVNPKVAQLLADEAALRRPVNPAAAARAAEAFAEQLATAYADGELPREVLARLGWDG